MCLWSLSARPGDVSTRVCPASRNSGGRVFNNWEDYRDP
jgi:hypothetical protein